MSGREFEHFTSDVLQGLGYRTTILGGSGDQGIDVIARGSGKEIAIQCKNYDRPVGNRPVQEVYAGAHHHGCTDMWVIAPKGFTKGAIGLAQNVGVSLYDYAALRSWTRLTSGLQKRRTVYLEEEAAMQDAGKGMERHTIEVGLIDGDVGETVSFTAKLLGTAAVNGGKEEDGMDFSYYRLPDGCHRVLVESEGVAMLEPSDMSEALENGEPVNYGRWTLEKLQAEGEYGSVFEALMENHPETRRNTVRDID